MKLGEDPDTVHLVGCPRMDLVAEVLARTTATCSQRLFGSGVGGPFDLDEPFLIVSQHPVTTEYGDGERQIPETLAGGAELDVAGDRALAERRRGLRGHRARDPQVPRAQATTAAALLQEPADETTTSS